MARALMVCPAREISDSCYGDYRLTRIRRCATFPTAFPEPMMSDLAQRLESALTRASATLLSAHAHLCLAAAARLSSRLPAARAVALYCRAHDLSQVDERWIRMQVLARMGAIWPSPGRTIAPGAGRIERIRHTMRQWVRVRFAPFGDPAL